jgi:hypothetical protein
MEIPAALHGLQNQYENIRSHFNFGSFDPLEQAFVFRKEVEKFFSSDQDENVVIVCLDKPSQLDVNRFQQAQILLKTLWMKLT